MHFPKTFISYSHDSADHKKWVRDLATRMRRSGIDVSLDQWDLHAGEDLAVFMEKNLRESEFIIMVCTENYVHKAEEGTGGVGYEKMIITSEYLSRIESSKVIPIIKQTISKKLPQFLKTKLYIDFSNSESDDFAFEELVRTLLKVPLFEKPEIGKPSFIDEPLSNSNKQNDPIINFMKLLADDYEEGKSYSSYYDINQKMKISRFFFDDIISQATSMGLIEIFRDSITISDHGKEYIIQNKLYKKY